MPTAPQARPESTPSKNRLVPLVGLLLFAAFAISGPLAASAQDWGEEDDGWSSPPPREQNYPRSRSSNWNDPAQTAWSVRAGLGFTVDPDDFLLNFEAAHRFDQYVSVGPMMQVGVEDDRFLVAPTLNLTITMPGLPGEGLDRLRPNVFAGVGFAVIENDDRGGDNRAAGFLVNAGFGLDYLLTERVSVGSRMILNFLPGRTLDENFFYTWEIGGIRLSF